VSIPRKSLLKQDDVALLKCVYGLDDVITVIHSQQKYALHLVHFILLHPSIFYTQHTRYTRYIRYSNRQTQLGIQLDVLDWWGSS